jgi:chemotaxis-related protein WspD
MGGQEGRLQAPSTEVLVFRLGREWLALPTILFEQAAHIRPTHPLPNRRTGAVIGLTNVRGELLICISLEKVLGLQEVPSGQEKGARRRDRLLVINAAGARLAFAVDDVDSIYKYSPLELSPVPSTLAKASVRYTSGALVLGGKNVGRLDEERLIGAVYASFA